MGARPICGNYGIGASSTPHQISYNKSNKRNKSNKSDKINKTIKRDKSDKSYKTDKSDKINKSGFIIMKYFYHDKSKKKQIDHIQPIKLKIM